MIHFRTSVDGTLSRVTFSPRPGTSRGAKEIHRQLVYGYHCPFCRNAVLFAFLTPEKVPLRKYEESWVVNGAQHIRKVIPGDSSDHETAYHTDWAAVPGRTMGLQRVRMKNHILSEELIGKKEAAHQPGTRCCPYVGVFSSRRDLLIKDTILMGGFPARELASYNLPSWEEFEQIIQGDTRHFFHHGIGPNPLIMVRSDWIQDQKGIPHWREALLPFKKPKPIAGPVEVESGEEGEEPEEPEGSDDASAEGQDPRQSPEPVDGPSEYEEDEEGEGEEDDEQDS